MPSAAIGSQRSIRRVSGRSGMSGYPQSVRLLTATSGRSASARARSRCRAPQSAASARSGACPVRSGMFDTGVRWKPTDIGRIGHDRFRRPAAANRPTIGSRCSSGPAPRPQLGHGIERRRRFRARRHRPPAISARCRAATTVRLPLPPTVAIRSDSPTSLLSRPPILTQARRNGRCGRIESERRQTRATPSACPVPVRSVLNAGVDGRPPTIPGVEHAAGNPKRQRHRNATPTA